jgi:transposase-like protein
MRNVLAVVPKGTQDMVASIIRTIFAQPDAEHVRAQFDEVARMLTRSHPKVAQMLDDAKEWAAVVISDSGFDGFSYAAVTGRA